MEHRPYLTEVVAGSGDLEQFLAAALELADELEFAFGDDVDQLAHRALLEQHLAGAPT